MMPESRPRMLRRWITRDVVLGSLFRRGGLNWDQYFASWQELMRSSPESLESYQIKCLKNVLATARGSRHYQAVFKRTGIEPEDIRTLNDVRAIPPLEKEDLREKGPESFLTATPRHSFRAETAGTSGTPVTVVHDTAVRARQLARRWACQMTHGLHMGDREARFWGRSSKAFRSGLLNFLANRMQFQFFGEDEVSIQDEALKLRAFNPDYAYGYSSLLLRAANHFLSEGGAPINMKAVICTAETVQESQLRMIADGFGCPALVEYGCSEVDIIAHTCRHGQLHVISPDVILEIDPAGGDHSGEALVTDLTNCTMPIIRYRLGDTITMSSQGV